MLTLIFYSIVLLISLLLYSKDKRKTCSALKNGFRSFENILPLFLSLLLIIGMILSIVTPEIISALLGSQSGFKGTIFAAIIGSCTIVPGFITFPLAESLLKNGAGLLQITVFISTSVMVGVLTLPIEIRYLGKKIAYLRNTLSLAFSFLIALLMEELLK